MKEKYDVIIIGAGPAGISCAAELQKSNKTVLLAERNDKIGPKICAGGITTKVYSQKPWLAKEMAFNFSSVKVTFSGKQIDVASNKPFVSTITRERLGDLMLKELDYDKVDVVTGTHIKEISGDYITVNGKKVGFDFLVGADGSTSVLRKHLGVKIEKFLVAVQYKLPEKRRELELVTDAEMFGSHYAWIFPHSDYTIVGAVGCKKSVEIGRIKENLDKWMKEKGFNSEGVEPGIAIINFDYRGFDFGNKFLVGDAGGFASGITGEGIYFGIASGIDVAKKIIDPSYGCEEIKRVVKIKRLHERVLSLAIFLKSLSPAVLNFFFITVRLLFKSKRFTRFAIKTFS